MNSTRKALICCVIFMLCFELETCLIFSKPETDLDEKLRALGLMSMVKNAASKLLGTGDDEKIQKLANLRAKKRLLKMRNSIDEGNFKSDFDFK